MTDIDDKREPTDRERRRQETAERILDAAMELINEGGYESFTIARLAGELDCAVGALYRYFTGKDAILRGLQLRCIERIADDLRDVRDAAVRASSDLSEREGALLRVLSAVVAYESLIDRRPTDYRLLALSLGDPRHLLTTDLVRQVFDALRGVLAVLSQALEEAAACGALDAGSSDDRAFVLWGATQGLLQLRKLERVEPKVAQRHLFDEMLRAQLVGWGADGGQLRALQARARSLLTAL